MDGRFALMLSTALAPLVWGSTYLVTTEFLPPDRPLYAALLRVLPAGVLLLLWAREVPPRAEWKRLFLLGMLNIGFFQAMLFVSAYRLPGGLAAILTSTQTLMVMVLTAWLGVQRPPLAAWLAAGVGVVGIALLVYAPGVRFDAVGIVAALLTALAGAVGAYFSKYWHTSLSLLAFTGWQLLFGGLCLLPLALWLEPPLPRLSATQVGGYLYLCLFGSVLAYVLFFRGIQRLPVAVAMSLSLLSPVSAFILGWLFLDQRMDGRAVFGFVLALLSIFGVQRALQAKTSQK
ncbi:MAG: EamA family transporter [Cardiobacteriaceae bacterium]|nr:EamA family transporter [Cardiobacteriaceae bacterium]